MCAALLFAVAPTAQAGINAWTSHGPEGGGTITTLAIDPSSPSTLYAGSPAGVFKSTDSGATWSPANAGLPESPAVYALIIDPIAPHTLYAATNGGVYKTTDGGGTWNAANTGLPGIVDTLAIDPVTPTTLYSTMTDSDCNGAFCGPTSRLYRSTDAGATWSLAGGLGPPVGALAIAPGTPTTLYAETEQGVRKSTDGGANWDAINATLPASHSRVHVVIDPVAPNTLYFWASDVSDNFGPVVFTSPNAGATWNWANIGLPRVPVGVLAVDPITPGTLYAGMADGSVYKTTDGGVTWNAAGRTGGDILTMAIDPVTPSTLYAGTSFHGVFKSTDGGMTWKAESVAPTPIFVDALALDPITPGTLYAGTGGGVFKSTNEGSTWERTGPLTNASIVALAVDPITSSTLYAVTQYHPNLVEVFGVIGPVGGVFKSTDAGATWEATDLTVLVPAADLAVDPITPSTLYALGDRVFKSMDAGLTWYVAWATGGSNSYRLLVIDPVRPSTLYAGACEPRFPEPGCTPWLWKSTDGGRTWTATELGFEILALAIDPRTPSTLYAGTAGGVFKSTDAGATWWQSAGAGLGEIDVVVALAIDPKKPTTLYAGTGGNLGGNGVFKSTDGAASWHAFSDGLTDTTTVNALAIDPKTPTKLYAATAGGVFSIRQVGFCTGDCNMDGDVRVNELVTLVNIGLGEATPAACPGGVPDGADVDIGWIISAVDDGLHGCE